MSQNSPNHNQEIDLFNLFRNLKNSVNDAFYGIIRYTIKNIFIIAGIIIAGAVIGYLIDQNQTQKYRHEVVVVPNFESNSFLYSTIKNFKPKKGSDIASVEIEPVIDIYQLLATGTTTLPVLEFLNDSNVPLNKHKGGNQTETLYKYHKITIVTKVEDTDGSIVQKFIDDLNNEKYFLERQKVENEYIASKIKELEISIENINNVFQKSQNASAPIGKEFNIEVNTELAELMGTKTYLIDQNNRMKIKQIEQSKIVYEVSKFDNIKQKGVSTTLILPVFLIGLFIVITYIIRKYNRIKTLKTTE